MGKTVVAVDPMGPPLGEPNGSLAEIEALIGLQVGIEGGPAKKVMPLFRKLQVLPLDADDVE